MILKNKTRITVLIFLVAIVTINATIHGKLDSLNILAAFGETKSPSNNILKISEGVEMSNDSSKIIILAEECQMDPLHSELGPSPRLGWTNPRIPYDPDPELECLSTTPTINSTTNR
ncbi:MAG: hypothetical protein AB7U98_00065 [Candidatus Nitrosocosmicus sp.]